MTDQIGHLSSIQLTLGGMKNSTMCPAAALTSATLHFSQQGFPSIMAEESPCTTFSVPSLTT